LFTSEHGMEDLYLDIHICINTNWSN
jgi:hypothetical protein